MASLSVTALRCEYLLNPIGIDVLRPRLSWQIESDRRGVVQSAYQIQVSDSEDWDTSDLTFVWDSRKVDSNLSIHITYEGPKIVSRRRYYWRVRIWDETDQATDWSSSAYWEMGLLHPTDWRADWITPAWNKDPSVAQPCPLLRSTFFVDGQVKSARAYASSLGLYELHLNGTRIGLDLFTPGWTSYHHRVQYQTYDISEHIQKGDNAVGAILGDGWYRGFLGWHGRRNSYGQRLALILQIQITYEDGREAIIVTDPSWKASTGPILMSDIYRGEIYDARLEKPDWSQPFYLDSDWQDVEFLNQKTPDLVASLAPPVRRNMELPAKEVLRTPDGETLVDFGQNLVGWVKLKVSGSPGESVTLHHAEVLDSNNRFYTNNLRSASQKVTYVMNGEPAHKFEPHFSFQGFRYVLVQGCPDDLTLDSLVAVVIHSDMEVTGHWECSNPLLNQLQHNIQWGQRGNFLDVPTDCPQRDERMGWTGDAQVFARTAMFNMNVASFFSKWLNDLALDQKEDGSVPSVIPDVLPSDLDGAAGATGWADACVIIPWAMYQHYGDVRILENQYESMKAWIGYMRERAGDNLIWTGDFHFGDWLSFSSSDPGYPGATTDKDFIATGYFAHSTRLMQKTAKVLGFSTEAAHFNALFKNIKSAFQREFISSTGRLTSNTQTAYALALMFDLFPLSQRTQAAERLAQNIVDHGYHLSTGFLGTPLLCPALGENGQLELAYQLLLQESYPSWLYPINQGATTIWERWDGIKEDGSFQDEEMNSFNHYAYGAIGEWMYTVAAGINVDPSVPGYKHIILRPQPGGGLNKVSASLISMYGKVACSWQVVDEHFHLEVRIPPNTYATIYFPSIELSTVQERGRSLDQVDGIYSVDQGEKSVILEVGSGQYTFTSKKPKLPSY